MADRIPLVLKFSEWSQSDKTAWEALFVPGDIFDDLGPCVKWSKGSRVKRTQGYGQWLSFVRRTEPDALNQRPAVRVTQARARAFVEECEARLKPASTSGLVSDLYVVIRLMAPEIGWAWLAKVSKRLQGKADRKALPPPHTITAGEILYRCLERLEGVEEGDHLSPKTHAIRYRQALMIAFLVCRPVRRRTLLGMNVGKHLRATPEGFHVHFTSEDMKDKKARDFALPESLVVPMQHYLDTHRPVLLQDKTTGALWLGEHGDPVKADSLSKELPRVTKQLLGVLLRPHAFRHIAATTIAETDPGHVNIIRDVLGHSTLEMAEKHYNRATGMSACKDYASVIGGIRKSATKQR